MSTEIVYAINFDEAGDDIHVRTLTNDDYTGDFVSFGDNGVTLKRDTIDIVFIPYININRIYQEI